MANRNAHFKDSAMFHGSDHAFNVGDTVLPGKDGFAWASTNRDVAAGYGSKVYTVKPIAQVYRHTGASKEFGIHYSPIGYTVTGTAE